MQLVKRGILFFTLFIIALSIGVTTAFAEPEAVINVTTNADEYDTNGSGAGCSLREAITAANTDSAFGGCNAGSGKDKIVLQAATYFLTRAGNESQNVSGDLNIHSKLTLQGAGQTATIINGNDLDRVIVITESPGVVINDMTITNGTTTGAGGGINARNKLTLHNVTVSSNHANLGGGGIVASGTNGNLGLIVNNSLVENNTSGDNGAGINTYVPATITASTIRNNTTQNSGALGGGIFNYGNGNLVIHNSTINNNTAEGHGGGLYNEQLAAVVNSTISGNNAKGDGGGIANVGIAVVNLFSVTIANNHADSNNNNTGLGGGIYNGGGTVEFRNSILANNTLKTALPTNNDCEGALTSRGFNLIEAIPVTCDIGGSTGNIVTGQDPALGILGPNGGATWTHSLAGGSPAIDKGAPYGCTDENDNLLATDQRGETRSTDGDGIGGPICDIGAYERPIAAACVAKPAAPDLSFPIDGSTNSGHKSTLRWQDADCAAKFKIIFKRGSPQGALVFKAKNIEVLEYNTPKLAFDTYYWRVIASNPFGKSKSAWNSFSLAKK